MRLFGTFLALYTRKSVLSRSPFSGPPGVRSADPRHNRRFAVPIRCPGVVAISSKIFSHVGLDLEFNGLAHSSHECLPRKVL